MTLRPVVWLDLKYDPDQPRDPSGTSTGGQWTDGGSDGSAGGGRASGPDPKVVISNADSAIKETKKRFKDHEEAYALTLDQSVTTWQDQAEIGLMVRHADNIVKGKGYIPSPADLREEASLSRDIDDDLDEILYGQSAMLLKGAAGKPLKDNALERYIGVESQTRQDPLYKAKVGDEFDFPLTAFTTNKFSEGATLEKDRIFSEKGNTQQKIVRFEDPKFGFKLGKLGYDESQTGEVLVTGRIRVKSIEKVSVPVYTSSGYAVFPAGKERRTIITLVRG